ncbi:PREDICTED: psbP domain-containing protein 2, chloroplastic [Lupinus angustifolius]|uniref:psbP domain-containing protein 2, chloroplastic n=1 Tax=Lupinus angustifolius TaxID=3871 RepID=UPI00092F7FAB|nr:PREDICTED: psbP domain-containing protein 2, chloroplastic [Lupinus angustifolius]XP_019415939.1 PREDICTED: psbP domain-containing protein 2, chloroplastic [Lupinus angustifolius]
MCSKICSNLLQSSSTLSTELTYASSKVSKILFPNSTSPIPRSSIHEFHSHKHVHLCLSPCLRRRSLTIFLTTFLWDFLPNTRPALLLAEESELQRYTDSKEGFTILIPSSWTKVDKAGATALFQEANMGSNNIGIVVNPVRLATLGEFGSPQFVADKLLQAERRKESTKDTEVITVAERSGEGGLQIYEFEYILDSTRGGMKRIFSAAFVASKKLYLLNITHSDKPESPLDPQKRLILEQVLHSFNAAI